MDDTRSGTVGRFDADQLLSTAIAATGLDDMGEPT